MRKAFFVLTAAMLFSSPAQGGDRLPAFDAYVCEGGRFRAQVPSGWERSVRNAPYADMTRVEGARFDGPPTGEGVPASIALYWYSGEKSFTTPGAYIKARLGSMVREDMERGDATAQVPLAGRNATAFHITTFELIMTPDGRAIAGKDGDPRVYEIAPPSRKVIMDEQYIVLPASKGYFVLHFRAPVSIADRYQAIFDRVTAGFEPLDKR